MTVLHCLHWKVHLCDSISFKSKNHDDCFLILPISISFLWPLLHLMVFSLPLHLPATSTGHFNRFHNDLFLLLRSASLGKSKEKNGEKKSEQLYPPNKCIYLISERTVKSSCKFRFFTTLTITEMGKMIASLAML